jgi:hypothetical protein
MRAKYHDINLYYVVLYITHLSLMFRDVLPNYYVQVYNDVYYKHKAWILLDFIIWLDPYMKFDFHMQVHVAISISYLVL